MNEYQITFKIKAHEFFGTPVSSTAVYEAESEEDARAICLREFNEAKASILNWLGDTPDLELSILNIQQVELEK